MSYITLIELKRPWVASRLVSEDWDFEEGYSLWAMLSIESQFCDILVELQLRVVGGVIYVGSEFAEDPHTVDRVSDILAAVYKWKKWTDSRWLSFAAVLCLRASFLALSRSRRMPSSKDTVIIILAVCGS